MASSMTLLARGVSPVSPEVAFSPRPMMNSTAERTLPRPTPRLIRTLAATPSSSYQAEQDMLGADVVMVEVLGFFLGQGENPAGSF